MQQRELGKTGLMVSEVGLGCEHLQGLPAGQVNDVIACALDQGVNILDIFMSEPNVRNHIGAAIKSRRQKIILQAHIGSIWQNGQYARSRDLNQCRTFFDDYLARLDTDYLDIGMLHFCDSLEDLDQLIDHGILDYAHDLKRNGRIRAVGLSSHDPHTAMTAVETGKIDVLMFSLNPAFDILPDATGIDDLFKHTTFQGRGGQGIHPAREALVQTCAAMGTGVTVMKGFAGGMLLSDQGSPFGTALTPVQCISYALSRPAVASVMAGCRTTEEVLAATAWQTASAEEKDFALALSRTPEYSVEGKCMYCNHCLPCPAHIDIAQVLKYHDLLLATGGDPNRSATIQAHYSALEHHASDCIHCGQCETRCPFSVAVMEKMNLAAHTFNI
ncbi:MAG: aldo/keto reductase [Clostridia bacterium]|nr:aldo/keto reductase [Clostridia bacterium]